MTSIKPVTDSEILERVLLTGDLSRLSPAERIAYYKRVCESLDLNPFTQPFAYIVLNGKLTFYALRGATEQLRTLRNISIEIAEARESGDGRVYIVRAIARTPDGRTDTSTGVVPIEDLNPTDYANAVMKAETKAKRRVTLSICGLGWLDESELDTIPKTAKRKPAPRISDELRQLPHAEDYVEDYAENFQAAAASSQAPPIVSGQAAVASAPPPKVAEADIVAPDGASEPTEAVRTFKDWGEFMAAIRARLNTTQVKAALGMTRSATWPPHPMPTAEDWEKVSSYKATRNGN